jgi:hypothetical protein
LPHEHDGYWPFIIIQIIVKLTPRLSVFRLSIFFLLTFSR